MANDAMSVLHIDDNVLKNLSEIEKRMENLRNAGKTTTRSLRDSFKTFIISLHYRI